MVSEFERKHNIFIILLRWLGPDVAVNASRVAFGQIDRNSHMLGNASWKGSSFLSPSPLKQYKRMKNLAEMFIVRNHIFASQWFTIHSATLTCLSSRVDRKPLASKDKETRAWVYSVYYIFKKNDRFACIIIRIVKSQYFTDVHFYKNTIWQHFRDWFYFQ